MHQDPKKTQPTLLPPRFLVFLLEKEVRLTYSLLLVGKAKQSAPSPLFLVPTSPLPHSFICDFHPLSKTQSCHSPPSQLRLCSSYFTSCSSYFSTIINLISSHHPHKLIKDHPLWFLKKKNKHSLSPISKLKKKETTSNIFLSLQAFKKILR